MLNMMEGLYGKYSLPSLLILIKNRIFLISTIISYMNSNELNLAQFLSVSLSGLPLNKDRFIFSN